MSTHHPIAIIGGGLGGPLLARVLHVNGIESVVYDLDASLHAHPQGGMLDIHEDSGQPALRDAGLFDTFCQIIYPGGEAMRILDKHATVRHADEGFGTRPEVSRGALRNLLISSLPNGMVHWGSKVAEVHTLADGRHEVTLTNGETFTADLLVGADGAWSKVRTLVSDVKPIYSGLTFVEVHLFEADTRHASAAALVGGGSMFALSDEKGMTFHRDPDSTLHGYIALKTPADWSRTIDFTKAAAIKTMLLEHFVDWDERLQAMITGADGAIVPRPLFALPVGYRWTRVPGVTLLGDAAHVMAPFAGEGANLALQDAAELARAIIAHPHDVDHALTLYEQALFLRSEVSAAVSAENLTIAFRADAPQGMVDLMVQYGVGDHAP